MMEGDADTDKRRRLMVTTAPFNGGLIRQRVMQNEQLQAHGRN
jgi:hypothetical protein